MNETRFPVFSGKSQPYKCVKFQSRSILMEIATSFFVEKNDIYFSWLVKWFNIYLTSKKLIRKWSSFSVTLLLINLSHFRRRSYVADASNLIVRRYLTERKKEIKRTFSGEASPRLKVFTDGEIEQEVCKSTVERKVNTTGRFGRIAI